MRVFVRVVEAGTFTKQPIRCCCPVYVVYPPNRHLSAKVRAFVDWVAELFQREAKLQVAVQ